MIPWRSLSEQRVRVRNRPANGFLARIASGTLVRLPAGMLSLALLSLLGATRPGFCESPPPGDLPVFVNFTRQAGINFVSSFGDSKLSSILEATGSGCAFLDYDNDGDLDIYLVNGAYLPGINDPPPRGQSPRQDLTNRLLRNDKGVFRDVTLKAGVGDRGYGAGVVAADYDNDGATDLFICNYGPNVLYHNNRDGTFTDVTRKAGVAGPEKLNGYPKWSVHGAFLDYDRDGYLDLYVGNYLAFDPEYRNYFAADAFPGPLDYRGQPDILYHNNRDGTFTDVTTKAGLLNPDGRAMSVTCGDYNNDGRADIFAANDGMENYLFRNNGNGTFTNVAVEMGVAFGEFGEATSAMGPDFQDFDNNGFLDLYVPDMGYSCLYRNNGSMFEEVTAASGIARVCGQFTGWGTACVDYDNDGFRDIYVNNGDAHHLYTQQSVLLRNKGNGKFDDVSLRSGDYFVKKEYVGRGAAFGDYDNDGDVDILATNLNGPAVLLRNEGGNRGHWLTVRTVGTKSNRQGIGARLRVVSGGSSQIAEVKSGSGYLSTSDTRAHFGLGRQTTVDLLEIRWPSGVVQTLKQVRADQILTVKEPAR